MKKQLIAILTVLCLLVSTAFVAFAYDQASNETDWVSNITCDTENGTVTFEFTDAMETASAYTWQVAIFSADPTPLASGDDGFWAVYRRSNLTTASTFGKTEETGIDSYVCGANAGGSASDKTTLSNANAYLTQGTTYYAVFATNSDGGNGWSWLNKAYSFTYGTAATTHNEPDTISSLAVNDGTLNVTLLDTFTNAIPEYVSVWDNNGTMEVIDTSSDKGLKITPANSWISASLSCWDGNNEHVACDFVHKTDADTKYLVFSISVDGTVSSIGIEPQFTGDPGGLRQAYLNDGTDAIYLVDANGIITATVEYVSYRYQITNIPTDFTGYIVLPTSRLRLTSDGSEYSNFGKGTYADYVNMYVLSFYVMSSNNDSLIVDKMYYTSEDIQAAPGNGNDDDSVTATNAQIDTPNGKMDITIIDDFSSYTSDDDYTSGSGVGYAFDGSVLTVTGAAYIWGQGEVDSVSNEIEGIDDLYNNANYIGFKIKNDGENDVSLAFENSNGWNTQIWAAEGAYLVSDTAVTEASYQSLSSTNRGQAVVVPAGFEGYVFIPFESMKPFQNGTEDPTNSMCSVTIAFAGLGVDGDTYEIDNICLASEIPMDNDNNDNNTDDDNATDSADISVIAYAVAALTASGAIVAIKRKRA